MLTTLAKKMDMQTKTKFGIWNVRTMTEPGKLEIACAEIDRLNIDILGLADCRQNGNGEKIARILSDSGMENGMPGWLILRFLVLGFPDVSLL